MGVNGTCMTCEYIAVEGVATKLVRKTQFSRHYLIAFSVQRIGQVSGRSFWAPETEKPGSEPGPFPGAERRIAYDPLLIKIRLGLPGRLTALIFWTRKGKR